MDTDYLSQLQRGDRQILTHLAQIKPQSIGITIITDDSFEIHRGIIMTQTVLDSNKLYKRGI